MNDFSQHFAKVVNAFVNDTFRHCASIINDGSCLNASAFNGFINDASQQGARAVNGFVSGASQQFVSVVNDAFCLNANTLSVFFPSLSFHIPKKIQPHSVSTISQKSP
jgi:hypothetical protein